MPAFSNILRFTEVIFSKTRVGGFLVFLEFSRFVSSFLGFLEISRDFERDFEEKTGSSFLVFSSFLDCFRVFSSFLGFLRVFSVCLSFLVFLSFLGFLEISRVSSSDFERSGEEPAPVRCFRVRPSSWKPFRQEHAKHCEDSVEHFQRRIYILICIVIYIYIYIYIHIHVALQNYMPFGAIFISKNDNLNN